MSWIESQFKAKYEIKKIPKIFIWSRSSIFGTFCRAQWSQREKREKFVFTSEVKFWVLCDRLEV